MTAKELLNPRFEVIADYPDSNYKVGKVVEVTEIWEEGFPSSYFEKYPHIFKKLNWWDKRTKEQMPKKLKSLFRKDNIDFDLEKEEVIHIVDWDMRNFDGFIDKEKNTVCSLLSLHPEYSYIPVY